MSHPDPAYRIGAIHRAWRNGKLPTSQAAVEMAKLGALNTFKIWERNPPPSRKIEWAVSFFGRKQGSDGIFYAMKASVFHTETPSDNDVITVLNQLGWEVNHIRETTQVRIASHGTE